MAFPISAALAAIADARGLRSLLAMLAGVLTAPQPASCCADRRLG